MCRSNYNFVVIHNVFMYHLGIKSDKVTKELLDLRQKMASKAKKALVGFDKRMDRIYPSTKKKCPKFNIPLPE